jgi:hypothetical protein
MHARTIFSVLPVGVMYSGEYDACDVTLSVYPHRAGLKNMPVPVRIEPTTFGILSSNELRGQVGSSM